MKRSRKSITPSQPLHSNCIAIQPAILCLNSHTELSASYYAQMANSPPPPLCYSDVFKYLKWGHKHSILCLASTHNEA